MTIEIFNEAISGNKPVLVDFYADWCEPCKWLEPILAEVESLCAGKALVIRIDIDAFPQLKDKHFIMSVPVLIIFKKGEALWRMNGFKPAKELSDKLMEFV